MSRLRFTDNFSFFGNNTTKPTILLLIDPQNDFHLEKEKPKNSSETGMFIDGAQKSAENIAKFIMDKIDEIDEIIVTLDSHHKKHIAHKSFWKSHDGIDRPIKDYTELKRKVITEAKGEVPEVVEDGVLYEYDQENNKLKDDRWEPKDISLSSWVTTYAKKLDDGRNDFRLTIWPDHCLIGSKGYAIYHVIQGALQEWNKKHPEKSIKYVTKGMNCLTEMYSAIAAEVVIENDPTTKFNVELVKALSKANRLYVCGQASSHVVKYTMEDLAKSLFTEKYKKIVEENIEEILKKKHGENEFTLKKEVEKALEKKFNCIEYYKDFGKEEKMNLIPENIYLLEDCMNHVTDHEKHARKFLDDMKRLKCEIKKSTDLIKSTDS